MVSILYNFYNTNGIAKVITINLEKIRVHIIKKYYHKFYFFKHDASQDCNARIFISKPSKTLEPIHNPRILI